MWKHPAKSEPEVAQFHLGHTSHRPRSLLPHHAPSSLDLLPSFPSLPAPWEEGKGAKCPLVMEVRTGTGCSQVQIIKVVIVHTISRVFDASSALLRGCLRPSTNRAWWWKRFSAQVAGAGDLEAGTQSGAGLLSHTASPCRSRE